VAYDQLYDYIPGREHKIRNSPKKKGQLVTAYTPMGKKTYSNSATGTHSGSHIYLILQDSFQSYFPTYTNANPFLVSQAELYMHFTFSIIQHVPPI
jgi:hypothetical protein